MWVPVIWNTNPLHTTNTRPLTLDDTRHDVAALEKLSRLLRGSLWSNNPATHHVDCWAITLCCTTQRRFITSLNDTFSPPVLSMRTLCLSLFGSRFMSSSQHSRWGAAPNARCCGGQELPVISVGASDRPEQLEPVVHTRLTGKALAAP